MDRAGRRPLLLYPMVFMIFILIVITGALKFQVVLYLFENLLATFNIYLIINNYKRLDRVSGSLFNPLDSFGHSYDGLVLF